MLVARSTMKSVAVMSDKLDFSGRSGPVIKIAEDIQLRPLAANDVTMRYVDGLNDPQVNEFLVAAPGGAHILEDVQKWVSTNWQASDAIVFGLFASGRHVGNIRVHDITTRSASVGIAIFDTSMHGKGIGCAVISAVVRYLTRDLGIEQVTAGIDERNIASQKAFSKAGFEKMPSQVSQGCLLWGYPGRQ
jgi:RimJ/RimL family protein N-acetyltransferase